MSFGKTLAAIVLALGTGCASKGYQSTTPGQQDVRKLTHRDIVAIEDTRKSMRADYNMSRNDIDATIRLDEMLDKAVLADGEPAYVQDDLAGIKKQSGDDIEELFDNLHFYFMATGVNTKVHDNAPANVGATEDTLPVYLGTGKDLRAKLVNDKNFTYAMRKALVQMSEHERRPYKATAGVPKAGGGSIVGLKGTAYEINKEMANALVASGVSAASKGFAAITADDWKAWTNGDAKGKGWADGEMLDFYLKPVKQPYDLPKPEGKK